MNHSACNGYTRGTFGSYSAPPNLFLDLAERPAIFRAVQRACRKRSALSLSLKEQLPLRDASQEVSIALAVGGSNKQFSFGTTQVVHSEIIAHSVPVLGA